MVSREPFIQYEGIAAPIMMDNIDTDQIIPSREMKTVSRDGLGEGLFAGWRYQMLGSRELNPDFVLNKVAYQGATILLGGRNFGCGSSREHAVWALKEYGVRAIVAVSFGDIFYGNCIRNGLLPITLEPSLVTAFADFVNDDPQAHRLAIDLENQRITVAQSDALMVSFEIGEYHKRLLIEGLDPITLTLLRKAEIGRFLEKDRSDRPWIYR